MSNVIDFPAPPSPDEILSELKGTLESAVVMGWNPDGQFVYGISKDMEVGDILLLQEILKAHLLAALTETFH